MRLIVDPRDNRTNEIQLFGAGRVRFRGKKLLQAAVFSCSGLGALFVLYLVLICHPGLFFRYTFARGAITLYSDEPIPPEPAGRILDEVKRRLMRSPLAASDRLKNLRVYICNRRWRFILFANYRYNVGGLVYNPISDNIFLRAVHFDANRLVSPSGREVPGERTLTYFIAHEAMHVLVGRELGIVKHWQLPPWKNEGYADLVANGGEFDYQRARTASTRRSRAGPAGIGPLSALSPARCVSP